jgi:Flp pilus assembly pilin Flp
VFAVKRGPPLWECNLNLTQCVLRGRKASLTCTNRIDVRVCRARQKGVTAPGMDYDGSVRHFDGLDAAELGNNLCQLNRPSPLCWRARAAVALTLPPLGESAMLKSKLIRVRSALRNSRAATMAEYAILVAVIALVVIIGARFLGSSVSSKMRTAATSIGT